MTPHLTMVITTINPSEIVVMFTNLAIDWGPHIVPKMMGFMLLKSLAWLPDTISDCTLRRELLCGLHPAAPQRNGTGFGHHSQR